MTQKTARAVDDALGGLPLDDRLVALVVSVITRRPEAIRAVLSLLSLTSVLARELPLAQRIALSEVARDVADEIERRRHVVPIG